MSRTTLLILGASGDLTKRLLLPGIGSLLEREPDRSVRIVGVARRDIPFRDLVEEALRSGGAPEESIVRVLEDTGFHRADVTDAADLDAVLDAHADAERLVIYFATSPSVTEKICDRLMERGVPDTVHLALEKPFGDDLASAEALNGIVQKIVTPDRAFRIDHFLGMTSVLDLLTLRFASTTLGSVWDAEHIESVEISYDEDLALENRAGYYDHAGALVDMFQSHMLQIHAVVAMEPPSTVGERDHREAKTEVLRRTRLWGDDPATATRRGRYTAGRIGDREIPSYLDEEGVDASRDTETLAQVTLEVDDPRWAGVPFVLRSGKAIGNPGKHIAITLRPQEGSAKDAERERLVIDFEPATMRLRLSQASGDDPFSLKSPVRGHDSRDVGVEAYSAVITAILDGDVAHSVSAEIAEVSWRITEQILDCWENGGVPMDEYPAGSPVPEDWGALRL